MNKHLMQHKRQLRDTDVQSIFTSAGIDVPTLAQAQAFYTSSAKGLK